MPDHNHYVSVSVCVCVLEACVDADSAAVRDVGVSWLRWKGQRVEFCRCAVRGRVRCHQIPV